MTAAGETRSAGPSATGWDALPGASWPADGGALGEIIRELDWTLSPLGHPAGWGSPLRTVVDLMLPAQAQMVLFWGPHFVALYNDAYAPTIGGRHPGALGRPARENWAEMWDDLEPLLASVRRTGETVSARDRPFHMERHGYPETAYFDISYSAVHDEAGAVDGVLCIVSETTERVRAQESLRASAAELRLVADSLPVLVTQIDRSLTYRFANQASQDWLNAPPEAVVGRPVREVIGERAFRQREGHIGAALAGEAMRFELPWPHADGTPRIAEIHYLPRRDADGTVESFYAFVQDVTARVEGEQALQRAAERLEREVVSRTRERDRLWRNSLDLLVVVGPDGVLQAVNPAWTAILGYAEAELVGASFDRFVHPDDTGATFAAIAHASHEHLAPIENRYRHKDGSWRWFAWTAGTWEDRIYANGRDVTAEHERAEALRQAEEALRQSQKMEAIGHLTGGIAHDFNNLLQGIMGSLDLMQARIARGRMEGLDRYIEAAMASAGKAASLTHRLLAFGRRQPIAPKPLRINMLVASMAELLHRTLGPSIKLDLELSDGLWPVRADSNQLENALLNLVINARDAMPEGGTLTIQTSNLTVEAQEAGGLGPGQYVRLAVSDTGSGMAPEVIERAFDPFYTTKPPGQGTGLGLSMVYGFARQSEGHARIRSAVGQGTTVALVLPRYAGALDMGETLLGPDAVGGPGGRVVVVVEDEPVVRSLVVEVLGELGYRTVIEAGDGPGGLRALDRQGRVDLLITDMGLPGLGGRRVAEAARQARPGLRVLFMTGYAEQAALAEGFLEPGMELITKPFTVEALAQRIRTMMDTG